MNNVFPALFLIVCFFISGCSTPEKGFENGIWRGVMVTDSAISIPFNFEVYDSAGTKQVAYINGQERLNINQVVTRGDSVIISTPMYETEIRAVLTDEGLEGEWVRSLPDRQQRMPFTASSNTSWRFASTGGEADASIAGRWSAVIRRDGTIDSTLAVGEFRQTGAQVSGTFLTNVGDYRFLSGEMEGNTFSMSAYAGAAPMLFEGTLQGDQISGRMYSGPASQSTWEARKNDQAALEDAYQITRLKPGAKLAFDFQDTEGNKVSLSDERFQNKVVVIQFVGSWCPNCMDETAFLSPFYKKYRDKGLEIIGLAYERYAEPEKAKKAVKNLMNRFDVSYPVLLTGYSNRPGQVLESLPALENFSAFPTTIILDKKGEVYSIHSGFDGPATGDAYHRYIASFEGTINKLIRQ